MEHEPRKLPGQLRGQLERSYGADLGEVTVHEDDLADQLGVRAVAHGTELHFARGVFDPETADGQHVIAHEAAHVVQQGAVASSATPQQLHGDSSLEREAEVAAHAALAGQPATLSRGVGSAMQGFDNWEHKLLGDAAMGMGEMPCAPGALPLTYGDYVSLSGDYFTTRPDSPPEDNLLVLAAIPSPKPGRTPGTQDEVIAALFVEQGSDFVDARFLPGGIWNFPISDEVKTRANERMNRLAVTNREHFSMPEHGRTTYGVGESAGGSYRAMHETALWQAYCAARSEPSKRGSSLQSAIIQDACGAHFLTDAFSTGHMRTPRADLRSYWTGIYPRFRDALVYTLGTAIAERLHWNATVSNVIGLVIAPKLLRMIREPIWVASGVLGSTIRDTIDSKVPAGFSFGDLLSKLLHDADNNNGLWVENDMGNRWHATGDDHLIADPKSHRSDKDTSHLELIGRAMKSGQAEIDMAFGLGMGTEQLEIAQLGARVRGQLPAPFLAGTDKYSAEQLMPYPSPNMNGTQDWQAEDLERLLPKFVRSDVELTYFKAISDAAQPGGSIYDQLGSAATDTTVLESVAALDPERAVAQAVLDPLQHDPIGFLSSILENSR